MFWRNVCCVSVSLLVVLLANGCGDSSELSSIQKGSAGLARFYRFSAGVKGGLVVAIPLTDDDVTRDGTAFFQAPEELQEDAYLVEWSEGFVLDSHQNLPVQFAGRMLSTIYRPIKGRSVTISPLSTVAKCVVENTVLNQIASGVEPASAFGSIEADLSSVFFGVDFFTNETDGTSPSTATVSREFYHEMLLEAFGRVVDEHHITYRNRSEYFQSDIIDFASDLSDQYNATGSYSVAYDYIAPQ